MLRDIQRQFLGALDTDGDAPPLFAGRLGAVGFAAYRNNWLAGTRKALATDYPVLARLVGEDCFAALARGYRRAHPSRSGDLVHFGAQFPAFLKVQYSSTAHAYLADVARLERYIDDCLLAPSAAAISIEQLADPEGGDPTQLYLRVHPAVRLLRSRWPVVAVWEIHLGSDDPTDTARVDLAAGGVDVILQRVEHQILMRSFACEYFDLLQALADGRSLATACTDAFGATQAEAAGQALAHLFAWGCFSGLELRPTSSQSRGEIK